MKVMAHSALVNKILTSPYAHDESQWPKLIERWLKEYIKSDLKFPLTHLDQNFLKKIEKTSASSSKKPRLATGNEKHVEEVARPSECSTEAPESALKKRLRFRKLTVAAS